MKHISDFNITEGDCTFPDAKAILEYVNVHGVNSVSTEAYELISCADCGAEMDGGYPNDCFGTTHGWCGECEQEED